MQCCIKYINTKCDNIRAFTVLHLKLIYKIMLELFIEIDIIDAYCICRLGHLFIKHNDQTCTFCFHTHLLQQLRGHGFNPLYDVWLMLKLFVIHLYELIVFKKTTYHWFIFLPMLSLNCACNAECSRVNESAHALILDRYIYHLPSFIIITSSNWGPNHHFIQHLQLRL